MWHVPSDGYLGHAWSLSLEEQFYVLWPPLLYFGFIRPKRESLLPFALIAILVVFALMRLTNYLGGELLAQRPDALFVGCLAAVLLANATHSSTVRSAGIGCEPAHSSSGDRCRQRRLGQQPHTSSSTTVGIWSLPQVLRCSSSI